MARDIIDDRLVGALHIRAMDKASFGNDPAEAHTTFQAGTLSALMEGHLGGDATIGEVLLHGDLGIGTVEHLAGELVVVDGQAFLVDAHGTVNPVPPETPTPFAVVCQFAPLVIRTLVGPLRLAELRDRLDGLAPGPVSVLAVRVDGVFSRLHLRSIHKQHPPYPTLNEVTEHQTEWTVPSARGSVVGLRFPDRVAGVEVPGYHLHFISDDRTTGGHVLDLTMETGQASVDGGDELHIELPDHVGLGEPGIADRAAIHRAEGG